VLKKSLGNKGVGCGQAMRAKNNTVKIDANKPLLATAV
jgi:hypothetical protein